MKASKAFEILHVDQDVVAVSKAAGVYSIPGRDGGSTINVRDLLALKYGDVFTVHRIDKDTSGVLLFARTKEAHRTISMHFEHGEVDKKYVALVRGNPFEEEGIIDAPLKTVQSGIVKVTKLGKPSSTAFKTLERFKGFSYLELKPITGRQHQIRVHLLYKGVPLIVDAQYNQPETFNIADIKHVRMNKFGQAPTPLLKRTPLHAISLRIGENEDWNFVAPLPKDMKACLNQLRKWRSDGK